jgi:Holliday junction resolvase RusA-like endonuclease
MTEKQPTRVELTLPEPPSSNRLWRNGRGRMYTDTAAKDFKLAVHAACLKAGITRVRFPEGTPVKLTLTWYRQRKAGDTSNRIKIVEDALNGLLWADDKQICELHVTRVDGQRPGRLHLLAECA